MTSSGTETRVCPDASAGVSVRVTGGLDETSLGVGDGVKGDGETGATAMLVRVGLVATSLGVEV